MKLLPILSVASLLLILPQAQARDRVSIGIGLSAGPAWGYGPGYHRGNYGPRYYGYHDHYCAPSYPVYSTPVYIQPPAPVYYAPPAAYTAPPVNRNVIRVQAALRQRRYYSGSVDGLSGPATQAAIRAYQLDRGLDVTGRIDAVLIADLGL